MMRSRFAEQIEQLNTELILMGSLCEDSLVKLGETLAAKDSRLLNEIKLLGRHIEEKEREIENICISLLLKQQPVASDLRRISAALKLITDLRRIGEQTANIAEILKQDEFPGSYDTTLLKSMAKAAQDMLSGCLDAFVDKDKNKALQVCHDDDVVDELFAKSKRELIKSIRATQDSGEAAVDYLMAAKYFEKICDHTVNIAEWIVYMITGEHKEEP